MALIDNLLGKSAPQGQADVVMPDGKAHRPTGPAAARN